MRKSAVTLLLLALIPFVSSAQQNITWSVDFNTIFENREGKDYYSPDQTIALTRLAPEIGVSMMGGEHNIAGGLSWIQPMGNGWKDYKLCPTLYYRYMSPAMRFSFGMFPRTQLIEPMPTVLWSDSLAYNVPNIRGVLFQYVKPKGFLEFSLDWRSLQTETQREAFNVNVNGRWNPKGVLLLGGQLQYNHLAKSKADAGEQNVNDDMSIHPYVGLDLSRHTSLDSFVVKAGPMIQFERDRGMEEWQTPCGVLVEGVAEWNFLGVKETLYAGKNLYPLYPKYGSLLNMGDPYFQADFYSRTNVYAYIFRNQFVNLEASLDFHYTKEATGFWQKILLRVYLDDKLWKNKKERVSRSEYLKNIY